MDGKFRLPLIPVFLAYSIGISLGHFNWAFPLPGWFLIPGLLFLWGFLLVTRKDRWGSWIALLLFFLLGVLSIQKYLAPGPPADPLSRFHGLNRIALEGTILRPPLRSERGTQLLIHSDQVILREGSIPIRGRVLLFLENEVEAFRVGDRLRVWCRLYPPRGFHNPGGFSYERHLAFERIHTVAFPLQEFACVKIGEGFGNPLLLHVEGWRDKIRGFLERRTSYPSSSILKALVLGEQGDIPEEVRQHFVVTGVAHLLAISGDHLGIVAFLSFSLLLWVLKRSEWLLLTVSVRKWAAALTIPCILLYTFIAGGGISVVRATLMVIIFFLSILFDRERNLLHTLALAAFLILVVSPPSLFDVSFQLSFLAVLSILYLVPRVLALFRRKEIIPPSRTPWGQTAWKYLKLSLLVTAVATLGTAPFVVYHFNRVSPIGLISNLFIVPTVGFLIVPTALLASLLSFFVDPVASVLIGGAGWLTGVLLQVVNLFASVPLASLFMSTPTTFEIVLFYLLLFLVVHLPGRKKLQALFLALSVVFILDLAYWNLRDRFREDLVLTFIDVGHGDSILVEFPRGKRMLVDGGGLRDERFDIGKNVIAPFLWGRKIRKIDYLVLTHPDPDHVQGLNFIASNFPIGQFWTNGSETGPESFLRLKETLRKKKVEALPLNETSPPQMIGGVQISVLNPPVGKWTSERASEGTFHNNQSLVLNVQFKNIRLLLTGDVEEEAEHRILRAGHSVKADLIKVPHHGSASSSTAVFLNRVRPAYAIVSASERNAGMLPHPEVLARYRVLGSRIFRTDRHGAITVVTDGDRIEVRPFLEGR
jgi:competence protein ComEC